MDFRKYLKNYKLYAAYVIALVLIAFFYPEDGKFNFDYEKGKPWLYETLIAPIDFPLLKSEEEMYTEREELASKIIMYYDYDNVIAYDQVLKLNEINKDTLLSHQFLTALNTTFRNIYRKGILIQYNDNTLSGTIIVQKDKRATQQPEAEVYDLKSAITELYSSLNIAFPEENVDSILKAKEIDKLLVPNLIYDPKKTETLHRRAIDYISPTMGMIYTGQLIVSEGEIVTEEVARMLNSYKEEYKQSFGYTGSKSSLFIGNLLISIFMLLVLGLALYFSDAKAMNSLRRTNFLLLMFVISFISTSILDSIGEDLLFVFPYAVLALFIISFFKLSISFPTYIVMLLPILIFPENGVELFFMNLMAGTIALFAFNYLTTGWAHFLNALFIFVSFILTYAMFRLLYNDYLNFFNTKIIFYLVCNALLVVGAYPLIYLFEKIFSLVSMSRLRELSDTNNKLLQELSTKAPGSFQHSLQVANMSQEAARKIGGNVMLAKVGALYHDVGKINNPQCFIENKMGGVDYHANLSPKESARDIIKHVQDGVEIAKKYRLPQAIISFIETHHANTETRYFYITYCNNGGDPNDLPDFTYKGELPSTKEQVIVMLADSIEAASRTLGDYSEDNISKLVDNIIKDRISNSVLDNADISMREINILKEMFKNYISHVYHARIVYPEKK